mgnify:CR=1 FL=1
MRSICLPIYEIKSLVIFSVILILTVQGAGVGVDDELAARLKKRQSVGTSLHCEVLLVLRFPISRTLPSL